MFTSYGDGVGDNICLIYRLTYLSAWSGSFKATITALYSLREESPSCSAA